MAPGSGKRKRPDRPPYSQEDAGRPSPHRPENLAMAHNHNQYSPRGSGRGGRGGKRGGLHTSYSSQNHNDSQAVPQAKAEPIESQIKPSQPSTPAPQPPAYTPPEPVEDSPADPIAFYAYEYLTDEVISIWKDGGRQSLLDTLVDLDTIALLILIQEVVRAGLDKRITAAESGSFIQDMVINTDEDLDVPGLFIDTISLLDDKDHKRRSLAVIVVNTGIDPDRFRRELDVSLLMSLQLVRPTFDRMRTRKTTNVLYRQANFNLLREESEGYAKMITDFHGFTRDANEQQPDPGLGNDAFDHVMALVGAFDLDVGRVLDITLDISANLLVKAYRFFLKFYRCSSWWPENMGIDNIQWTQDGPSNLPMWALPGSHRWDIDSKDRAALNQSRQERDIKFWAQARTEGMTAFFEIGGRKIVDFESILPLLEQEVLAESDAKGRDITADQRKRLNENRKYMKATRMLPPSGNPDAAQLLGFKLRLYTVEAIKADSLPENLIYLAAILIKVGFISLRDLYPHLHPSDEGMEQEKEKLEEEKQERDRKDRPGGGMNALALAGALADDTLPVVRNAKLDAAKSGGTTPLTGEVDQDKIPRPAPNQKILMLKALLAIGALPEALFILGKFPWIIDLDPTLPRHLHRTVNYMLHKVANVVRPEQTPDPGTLKPQPIAVLNDAEGKLYFGPPPPSAKGKQRKHLGLDCADNGDGYEEKHYYTDWDDNIPICQNMEDFFTLCNTFLQFLGVKVGEDLVLMITLIRLARHSLTEDTSQTNKDRWLDLIKRIILPALSLTKHNSAVTSEIYGLLSTFSIVTRFRMYEEWYTGRTSRLIEVKTAFDKNRAEVKDVLRRITNESGKKQARALAKVAFSSPGVVMMTFINQLESYSNMIPGLVDSVQYFNPLAFDILTWVLIKSLSGQGRDRIQADGMLTSAWLQSLSQFVASLFTRYNIVNPSPVLQYVASELRKGDSTNLELIDAVVGEMAGIRSDMNFNDTQLVAMTGGSALQSVIVQQLADIRHKRTGSAKRLMKALSTPGIDAQILIAIAQETQMYPHRDTAKYMPLKVLGNNMDKIHQVLAQYLDMLKTNSKPAEFEAVVPDVVDLIDSFGLEPAIAFMISRHVIEHHKLDFDAKKVAQKEDVVMPDAGATENGPSSETSPQDELSPPWHPVLADITNRLSAVTGNLSDRVSMAFFTTFWSAAPQDINCPLSSYESEREKVDLQRKELAKDRTNTSSNPLREREKKIVALEDRRKQLLAEQQERLVAVRDYRVWLNTQKKHWFGVSTTEEEKIARHINLIQECFLPRALLSALDANFCSTLLRIMHSNSTPGFSLLTFLDQLFRKSLLTAIIFQCTAREVENFARFICEVLKQMAHWHGAKKTYEHEAFGAKGEHTGFATELDETGKPAVLLDYEEFRRILFGWHNAIKDAFKTCFESGEYMHIRNGIIVLKSVHTVFPALKFHGKAMQDAIKAISEEDVRGDLKLAALSLQGPLKRREPKWVIPQDFKMGVKDAASTNEQPNGEVDMTDADADASKLNAAAPEFKPEAASLTNGSRKNSAFAEDGEIEDVMANKEADVEMTDASTTVAKTENGQTQSDGASTEPVKQSADVLPKRPEGIASEVARRIPSAQPPAKSNAQPNGRYSGRTEERYGRLDRPSDVRAPLSRSRSPVSRNHESLTDRSNDVAGEVQRIRREDRPPLNPHQSNGRSFRDDNPSGRSPRPGNTRDRLTNSTTSASHADRASQMRSDSSAPLSQQGPRSDRSSQLSSVVAQPSVNPQRAALINGDSGPRDDRDRRREQYDRPPHDSRPNGRPIPVDDHRPDVAPTGPRAGRTGGNNRDLFEQSSGRPLPADSGRGRLNRDATDSTIQPESSYGRLNADSEPTPPARPPHGPARGQRQTNGPPLATRASESNLQGRAAEPAAVRNPRHRGPPGDRLSTSTSNPDRISAVNSVPATPVSESGPAIHPSRLANLGTTIDTNAKPQTTTAGSPQPPSGPRAQGRRPTGTPTGPSPTNSLPTGPSLGGDRQRRGERARSSQTQASNTSPNGTQGVQFRGAARQASNTGPPMTTNGPAPEQPRALASSMEMPSRIEPTTRIDPGRQELMQRGQQGQDRGERQRPSRNSSKERRIDNDAPRRPGQDTQFGAPPRDDRGPRDVIPREKRGREDDSLPPRRPPPVVPAAYPNQPPNPDWNRGQPRGGYDDRTRDGGPQRGGEEFRAPRRADEGAMVQENDGRKRRNEEGPPFEAKRRRSGR